MMDVQKPMNNETTRILVDVLRRRGDLSNWRVEDAFTAVPRHLFLPGVALAEAYADKSIAVSHDTNGETLCSATMPSMVAYLLTLLNVEDGDNILEIGTGTGYVSALIRHMVGPEGTVTSLEIERQIAETAQDNLQRAGTSGVKVVNVDGAQGYAPRAAYDHIVSSAGVWDIPPAWIRQVKPGGRIVVPIALDGLQVATAFTRGEDGILRSDRAMPSAFVYIRGIESGPNIRKRVGSTALTLIGDDVRQVDPVQLHLLLSSDHESVQLSQPLNSTGYWYGFLPYLMLNKKPDEAFALYHVLAEQKAYGIDGEGFALLTPASACFVPYYGLGYAHCFAGADALLNIEAYLKAWESDQKPDIDQLRLRLIPKEQGKPVIEKGKIFTRRYHYLHVWFE